MMTQFVNEIIELNMTDMSMDCYDIKRIHWLPKKAIEFMQLNDGRELLLNYKIIDDRYYITVDLKYIALSDDGEVFEVKPIEITKQELINHLTMVMYYIKVTKYNSIFYYHEDDEIELTERSKFMDIIDNYNKGVRLTNLTMHQIYENDEIEID
jgi:hypothetical protein